MLRRWIAVVAAALVAFCGLSAVISLADPAPSSAPIKVSGPVIVVAVPGLAWSSVSRDATPDLWQLLPYSALGSVSVRSTTTATCEPDAWLGLSAGSVATTGSCAPKTPVVAGDSASWPDWSHWASLSKSAALGTVATTLAAHGKCVQAVGSGPALAAADSSGKVAHYSPSLAATDFTKCAATFVDAGNLAGLDAVMGSVPGDSTVIITGLSDDGSAQLRALAVVGPGVTPGGLMSSSTKRDGFVQAADVSATILSTVTATMPDKVDGQPLRSTTTHLSVGAAVASAVSLNQLLIAQNSIKAWFFLGWAVVFAVVVFFVRRWRTPACVFLAAVPVATFLSSWVPWWRWPLSALWLTLVSAMFAGLITALAYAGPWRRRTSGPFVVVALVTVVVMALDVIHGAPLQFVGMLGLQPIVGGRYYGMGNVGFGVFATAALLAAGLLAGWLSHTPRIAAATAALVGMFATVIDATPMWGADFGGVPPLLLGTAIVVLAALGIRPRLRTGVLLVAAAFVVGAAVAFADWLRPPGSRTHLGRFVQSLIDGNGWSTITEKLLANLRLTVASGVGILVPLALIALVYALIRPHSFLGARLRTWLPVEGNSMVLATAAALTVCWSIAFLLNDSGVVIPAVGGLLALPWVAAISERRTAGSAGLTGTQNGPSENSER